VIRETIERVGCEDEKALRKAISEAYPFGQRKHWPYKVWLSEVAYQVPRAMNWHRLGPEGQKAALGVADRFMKAEEEAMLGPLFRDGSE
jgi:hypothetical protein